MKIQLLFLSLCASVLWTAAAQTPIAIANPLFVDDEVECANGISCATFGISGWICGPNTGIQLFYATQYPSTLRPFNAAFIGSTLGTSGSIFQTLGATVASNTTYTLKVRVGARADYPFTGYRATLLAGNVLLATGNSATPVGGSFTTDTVVYQSGPAPAQLGQPLQIFIKSIGFGQVDVSAVSLTAE